MVRHSQLATHGSFAVSEAAQAISKNFDAVSFSFGAVDLMVLVGSADDRYYTGLRYRFTAALAPSGLINTLNEGASRQSGGSPNYGWPTACASSLSRHIDF